MKIPVDELIEDVYTAKSVDENGDDEIDQMIVPFREIYS